MRSACQRSWVVRTAARPPARRTYAAQYGWFAALTLIPFAQVVAIEFTMPIWTALLAGPFSASGYTAAKSAQRCSGWSDEHSPAQRSANVELHARSRTVENVIQFLRGSIARQHLCGGSAQRDLLRTERGAASSRP